MNELWVEDGQPFKKPGPIAKRARTTNFKRCDVNGPPRMDVRIRELVAASEHVDLDRLEPTRLQSFISIWRHFTSSHHFLVEAPHALE
jgi:hypothetical protein